MTARYLALSLLSWRLWSRLRGRPKEKALTVWLRFAFAGAEIFKDPGELYALMKPSTSQPVKPSDLDDVSSPTMRS